MDITWHGQSNFTLGGAEATVVIDPFKDIGLAQPKLSADVLFVSHGHFDHDNVEGVAGEPYIIDTPGEYESHGVMVEAIPSYHDAKQGEERGKNIIFSFNLDGFNLVHCGDLGHDLDEETVERLGNVDILFIPVGGYFTIDGKAAVDIIKKVQPRITVPMHYSVPGLTIPELVPLDNFLKEASQEPIRLEKPTWKIKQSDLPDEESQIVVFPNP